MVPVAIEKPMTLDGAAEALGCSRRWLQGWLSDNPDHGYKIGREWRFTSIDIAEMQTAMIPARIAEPTDPDMEYALSLCAKRRRKDRDPSFSCYAMRAGDLIKIGVAKDVEARRAAFQTGSASLIEVIAVWPGDRFDEARAHEALSAYRVHGEWFKACRDVLAFIGTKRREAL